MKLFENKLIVGGLCIFVAAILSFLVLPSIYQSKKNTIFVCKFKQDILAGTKIEKSLLKEVEIGGYGVPNNIIKKPEAIIGKYAKSNITSDDLLLSSKFSDYVSDDRMDRVIASNKKLVSVSISNNAASVANHLKAGDVITLVCYIDGAAQIYDELRNIEIYSIENAGSVNVDNVTKDEKGDKLAATFTLIADEKQAQKLVYAEYSGKIHAIFEKRGVGT